MSKRFATNEDVIRGYLSGDYEAGHSGNWNLYFKKDVLFSYGEHFPMSMKLDGIYVVNGDTYSVTTSSKHQSPLFRLVPNQRRVQIPFSALSEMMIGRGKRIGYQIDVVRELRIATMIDWEPDTYRDTGRVDKQGEVIMRHSLGGALFEYDGALFVTGMDLSGIEPDGMFFLTEINQDQVDKYGEPETVAEAMELLKPDEVKIAEEMGLDVKRQGEFYFVQDEVAEALVEGIDKKDIVKNYTIMNRDKEVHSHYASDGLVIEIEHPRRVDMQIVRGTVRHKDKEHRMLKLYDVGEKPKDRKWYVVYESIQGTSWKASGNVD